MTSDELDRKCSFMKQQICFISCLLFISFGSTAAQWVKIDPAEVEKMMQLPQDDWLNLTLMGTKIGYAHIYMEKSSYDEEDAIRVRADMVMDLKRTGTGLRLTATRISYVGMDLVPRYFITTSNETGREKRVEGRIRDGVAYLETSLAGKTTHTQMPMSTDTIFEQMIGYFLLRRTIRAGDAHTLHVFNLDLMRPVKTDIKVLREDQIEFDGKMEPIYVINYTMDIMGGLTTTGWLGHDGTMYRMEVGLMGLKMVLAKTDMQTALGESGEVDVILNTKIFAQGGQPIPHARRFKARLRLTEGQLDKAVIINHRQELKIDKDPRHGVLEIKATAFNRAETPNLPIQDLHGNEELAQFLKSTVYIQAEHPTIRAKAVEVLDGEINAWKSAEKLCRWVYKSIHDKNLKIGFGSALQTLESLEGDCTEHTVLMIAMARAVGIPARVCAGLVFQHDAFYYHFWPEVYVGEWVAMEPTLGQVQADANHIQLAGSGLESDSMLEFGEGVMRTLNQLEIEILE